MVPERRSDLVPTPAQCCSRAAVCGEVAGQLESPPWATATAEDLRRSGPQSPRGLTGNSCSAALAVQAIRWTALPRHRADVLFTKPTAERATRAWSGTSARVARPRRQLLPFLFPMSTGGYRRAPGTSTGRATQHGQPWRTAWSFTPGSNLVWPSGRDGPDGIAADVTAADARTTEHARDRHLAPLFLRPTGAPAASGASGPERCRGCGSAGSVAVVGAATGRARRYPAQARRSADPVPPRPFPRLARNRRTGAQPST